MMRKEMFLLIVSIITIFSLEAVESTESPRPHIIFIIADDLGWNDVGFHGSNQIPTPNIDALAYGGLILNRYYVNPICTPSRSALMTGKHPIHTGMQHTVLYGAEARGLPLSEKLLPQYLEELGYENHIVGKWHLGCYKKEYTPLYRGFKSHLGYWTGHQDYFDHTAVEAPGWGLDMRRGMEAAYDLHGRYSTDLFGEEAARIVRLHDPTRPLFLYLAHAAVHSGNPYNPLPAPDESVEEMGYVEGYKRRRFAAMLSKLDHSVGELTAALQEARMLNNSIIVFTTDNGGPAAGFNLNAASNWPLRGVKNTLWEGGVRGAALVWSPLIEEPRRVARQSMHIVDWLPTLVEAAGGNVSQLSGIDGISLWTALSKDEQSKRIEILHNIDDIYQNAAVTVGSWKLLKGTTYDGTWDGWYGPSGRDLPYTYNTSAVEECSTGRALKAVGEAASAAQMVALRREAEVRCEPPIRNSTAGNSTGDCRPLEAPCLFDVEEDPCERDNLASKYPQILQKLTDILDRYNATAIPPGNLPLDPKGNPKNWNYVWTNFGDYTNETVV